MDFNAFVGGIERGGLTNDFEVKILICYLLDKVGENLSFEQINEVIQETGYVNYFEYAEAMSELERSGQLVQEPEKGAYSLSPLGKKTSETFAKTIPVTVRERTVAAATDMIRLKRRLEEISVTYEKVADGYCLSMKIKDIGTDLLNLQLFVPTEKECITIRERIYQDPAALYRGMLTLLLGNEE